MPVTPATNPKPPPTRLMSYAQRVEEADPDWLALMLRPVIYVFSNGRQFVRDPNTYTVDESDMILLEDGTAMLQEDNTNMLLESGTPQPPAQSDVLMEDGTPMLQEDNTAMLMESNA